MTIKKKINNRLDAFSDGVYAIAITLLVLEIKVPPHDVEHLWPHLRHLWPSYFAFCYGFGMILVSWINHINVLSIIGDKVSRPFLYANGFLLLTVTFIPFPTAVFAEFISGNHSKEAISFYCLCTFLMGLGWWVLGHTIKIELIPEEEEQEMIKLCKKAVNFGVIVYLLTFILSFWFPTIAIIINFCLWVLWVSISLTDFTIKKNESN